MACWLAILSHVAENSKTKLRRRAMFVVLFGRDACTHTSLCWGPGLRTDSAASPSMFSLFSSLFVNFTTLWIDFDSLARRELCSDEPFTISTSILTTSLSVSAAHGHACRIRPASKPTDSSTTERFAKVGSKRLKTRASAPRALNVHRTGRREREREGEGMLVVCPFQVIDLLAWLSDVAELVEVSSEAAARFVTVPRA